jgi:3-hydroxy-9,10-secoandrosta-1,3,5(10)-triene-9,17-dione monooxygenase reductase component
MTANAVASLSLDPPMVVACFDRSSRTLAAVEHSRRFGINVLAHHQENVAALFASKLPETEKFAAVAWDERSRVPALSGCVSGIACEVRELSPGGDHLIGVGEVIDVWLGQGDPLVFFGGDYWRLGDRELAPAEVDRALEGPSGG